MQRQWQHIYILRGSMMCESGYELLNYCHSREHEQRPTDILLFSLLHTERERERVVYNRRCVESERWFFGCIAAKRDATIERKTIHNVAFKSVCFCGQREGREQRVNACDEKGLRKGNVEGFSSPFHINN
jgi:hypothetical protein